LFVCLFVDLTNCIITIENHGDLIDLKILGRSNQNTEKADKLLKEFEEQKYSRKKISNNEIHLFNDDNVRCLLFIFVKFN